MTGQPEPPAGGAGARTSSSGSSRTGARWTSVRSGPSPPRSWWCSGAAREPAARADAEAPSEPAGPLGTFLTAPFSAATFERTPTLAAPASGAALLALVTVWGCEVAGGADFLRRPGVRLPGRRPVPPRRPAVRTPFGLLGISEFQVAALVLHAVREVLLAVDTGDRLVRYVQLAPSADQRPFQSHHSILSAPQSSFAPERVLLRTPQSAPYAM
jgi:hypothetical protein